MLEAAQLYTWIDADGNETDFDGPNKSGLWVLDGVTGLGLPNYEYSNQARISRPGARTNSVRAASRSIFLPIEINAPDRLTYLRKKQQFQWMIDPTRGPGRLRIADVGLTCEITAQYLSGMEGKDGVADTSVEGKRWYGRTGITFDCPDVYFDLPGKVRKVYFGQETVAPRPFYPFLPIHVNRSQIIGGGTVVNNYGTAESYPVWTAEGPFAQLQIEKPSTGEAIVLTYAVPLGETVVIDTARPSITTSSGLNLYDYLDSDDFFTIAPGDNAVTMLLRGTTGDSSLSIEFTPRLLSFT